jgi:hypothetical protein
MQKILTNEEMDLLKQLKAAGERGRMVSTLNTPGVLRRLVRAGYVTNADVGLDLVRSRITKHGEYALSDAERFSSCTLHQLDQIDRRTATLHFHRGSLRGFGCCRASKRIMPLSAPSPMSPLCFA